MKETETYRGVQAERKNRGGNSGRDCAVS